MISNTIQSELKEEDCHLQNMKRERNSADEESRPPSKREARSKCNYIYQTITLTLKASLKSNNSKKVINTINTIVPSISSAIKATNLFLNWYANTNGKLYNFPPKHPENHLVFILRTFIGHSYKTKQSTLDKYDHFFDNLN